MERIGEILHNAASRSRNVILITADSGHYFHTNIFAKDFEDRLFNYGNAPQNALVAAAGFSLQGKVPILVLLAKDIPLIYEQMRNSISRSHLNVKIISVYGGLSAGQLGCSFQTFDDVALMRCLPNMKVYCPSGLADFHDIMRILQVDYGPAYVRLPWLSGEKNEEGPVQYDDGTDIAFLSHGTAVHFSKVALAILRELGIRGRLVNVSCLKPLDKDLIILSAKSCKVLVTVEDHSTIGGLGSAVSELLCEEYPRDMFRIGIEDTFGETALPDDLYQRYGLSGKKIAERVFNWWRELGYH